MKTVLQLFVVASCATILAGCSGDDNRTPTKQEAAAADVKRQSFIDNLNIPADQKAKMKAQMGGAPVADPAAAARSGGASQPGRTN